MWSDDRDPCRARRLGGIDHLEWWVGNARAFAGFLASAFGFDLVAYAGPETGRRDRVSYLLEQGRARFMVSGALHPDSPIAEHVRAHGDGIRDICFLVDDVPRAYDAALARGATSQREPAKDEDGHGVVHHAAIRAYGDTVHTFLDRSAYAGRFAPQFEPTDLIRPVGPEVGITRFDHVVANVERGHLDDWVAYYQDVLGFDELTHFDDEQISTEYSALMSTVVWNHDKVVLPINEPARGATQEPDRGVPRLLRHPGCAAHRPAHARHRGVGPRRSGHAASASWTSPPSTTTRPRARLDGVELPWAALAELGILVDRDHDGHLLQIFTETLTDRPTVFFEIIQREGATGFGEGNFKALFESIERAQARRGNL